LKNFCPPNQRHVVQLDDFRKKRCKKNLNYRPTQGLWKWNARSI